MAIRASVHPWMRKKENPRQEGVWTALERKEKMFVVGQPGFCCFHPWQTGQKILICPDCLDILS